MRNAIRTAAIAIMAALFLAAFSTEEARRLLDGSWQGVVDPISIVFDTKAGTMLMVNAGVKTSGSISIEGTQARSATIRIGDQRFYAHFEGDQGERLMLAKEGQSETLRLGKVK